MAIQGISTSIEAVSGIAISLTVAVEQQGTATAEIARNVKQTGASTQQITSNISGVSVAANCTGNAAGRVHNSAGDVAQQAQRLSGQVNTFVALMKAA